MKKIGRNEPCPCGSGKKYKLCCQQREHKHKASIHKPSSSTKKIIRLALEHYQAGRLSEAEVLCHQVLQEEPDHPEALRLSGVLARQQGKIEEAVEYLSRAINSNPTNPLSYSNLGNALRDQGKLDEAIACYQKAISMKADFAEAYCNLGHTYKDQGNFIGAADCYRKALIIRPEYVDAHFDLGNVCKDQGNIEEAIACYQRAIIIRPDFVNGYINLGVVFQDQGSLAAAADCYRKALSINPLSTEAHFNLGVALQGQGNYDDALTCYQRVLSINPHFIKAYINLGALLQKRGDFDKAIEHYRYAASIAPDYADAYYNLGQALKDQGKLDEDANSLHRAISINPDHAEARWALAMAQIQNISKCKNSSSISREIILQQIVELDDWFDHSRVGLGYKAVGTSQPFYLAYQEENNCEVLSQYGRLCARLMSDWIEKQKIIVSARVPSDTIRIGIVSAHFHDHSVWNAIVKGWLQHFDRDRFEIHLFYVGSKSDNETAWAIEHSSSFEYGHKALRQWVESILSKQVDVLIYPEIGMDEMTIKLASLRLAPVQIAAWGHPETTGLPTIDYYLSADCFEPTNAQENYTERLMTVPNLGCCYQPLPVISVNPDFSGLHIDPEIPILLCPGAPFKYVPEYDFIFPEIAQRLGLCQFIFFTLPKPYSLRSEKLRHRLEHAFNQRGMKMDENVIFIPWQNRPEFYGLMKKAAVFLDTIGFSGFNTAMQAIECGLPIVTIEGRFMRGRLASGILRRMELTELIAATTDKYIELAIKLIQDAEYRQSVRQRIETMRHSLYNDIEAVRALQDFLIKASAHAA